MDRTIEDKREIRALYLGDNEETCFRLKYGGCTKIVPYEERGEMSNVTWFAVYNNINEIISRINGRFVSSVHYED